MYTFEHVVSFWIPSRYCPESCLDNYDTFARNDVSHLANDSCAEGVYPRRNNYHNGVRQLPRGASRDAMVTGKCRLAFTNVGVMF